jgi:hypothetical protein
MSISLPIVVDLGRTEDEQVDLLRHGGGQILEDVEEVMRVIRRNANPDNGNKIFLPIVAVYRRTRRDGADTADEAWSNVSRSPTAGADEI